MLLRLLRLRFGWRLVVRMLWFVQRLQLLQQLRRLRELLSLLEFLLRLRLRQLLRLQLRLIRVGRRGVAVRSAQ